MRLVGTLAQGWLDLWRKINNTFATRPQLWGGPPGGRKSCARVLNRWSPWLWKKDFSISGLVYAPKLCNHRFSCTQPAYGTAARGKVDVEGRLWVSASRWVDCGRRTKWGLQSEKPDRRGKPVARQAFGRSTRRNHPKKLGGIP